MPSIISTTVGSTTVGANFAKAVSTYPNATSAVQNPNSQFGTRELAFHKITGATTGSTTNFAAIILALQTVAEVYYVNAVAATTLIVAVAANTNNGAGVGNTANDVTMKEAIDNAVYGTSTVTVGAADTAVFQTS
jgi:hypothetical protein